MRALRVLVLGVAVGFSCGAQATTVINILTAFTAGARAAVGGTDANVAFAANNQIARLNTALSNSGVSFRVASVGVASVGDLTSSPTGFALAASENIPLLIKRDATGADVVIVVHNLTGQPFGIVVAIPNPPTSAYAGSAFAAMSVAGLSGFVYQHEFAHLLGAHHQASGGVDGDDSAGLSYAHGYYVRTNTLPKSCYSTIMAYPPIDGLGGVSCTDQSILYYSNPSIGYSNNAGTFIPYGSSTSNNAAMLNNYGAVVANYHSIKIAPFFLGRIIPAIVLGIIEP